MIDWTGIVGFDWDEGNALKSTQKHGVSCREAEELFQNAPLLVLPDPRHSTTEERHHALGHTDEGRLLHIAFTIRGAKLRVISARPMNRKEKISMKTKVDRLRVPAMPARQGRTLDWSKAERVAFPDLKLTTETISLRMPAPLLHAIKREANRRDVPYQSLIKVVLAERFARA